MTNLSPAAQAVLDAFLNTPGEVPMPMWDYGRDLAAALQAAADQLRKAYADEEYVDSADDWLDAIAAELEALDD